MDRRCHNPHSMAQLLCRHVELAQAPASPACCPMARLERMKAKLLEWGVRWLWLPGDCNNVDVVEGHAVDRGGGGMSTLVATRTKLNCKSEGTPSNDAKLTRENYRSETSPEPDFPISTHVIEGQKPSSLRQQALARPRQPSTDKHCNLAIDEKRHSCRHYTD